MALPTLRRHGAALLGAALALTASSTLLAVDEDWILDDLAKAKAQAAEEGKDLLIDFTGSDWCVWCTRLDNEVFAQSQFKAEAPKNFVMVALDFPQAKPQTDEVKAANRAAQEKYGVTGFPTIILANAKGEAYAQTGYRPNGAGPYLEHLTALRQGRDKRDALMAEAMTVEGVERAKLLDQALNIQGIIVPDRVAVMEQIVSLDAENEAGLKESYAQKLVDARIQAALASAQTKMGADDFAAAETVLAGVKDIDQASDMVRGEYQMARISILYFQNKYAEMSAAIEKLVADEKLPADMRMQMSLARMEYAIELKDMAMAERIFDDTVAMGPQTQMAMMLGAQREQIMAQVKQRMEAKPAVPHDHDGDGVPDHAPGEHGKDG
jgi:thioredoxin-related protein